MGTRVIKLTTGVHIYLVELGRHRLGRVKTVRKDTLYCCCSALLVGLYEQAAVIH